MPDVLASAEGYTFDSPTPSIDGSGARLFTFRIVGPDGSIVRDYAASHRRELHFILVSKDLGTYAHLHPVRADDGTWSVGLPPLTPGPYRAFADFVPLDGPALTLSVELSVPGEAVVAPLPAPSAQSDVDGYLVTMAGTPATELELSVSQHGTPVTDLVPYLGAFGHLVAIRAGDLAYLHVHPLDDPPADDTARGGPTVRFAMHAPTPGDYRLFFDFSHGAAVHTAAFTVRVPG